MPVVSAIIPKWHENSCDYLLIIIPVLSSVDRKGLSDDD